MILDLFIKNSNCTQCKILCQMTWSLCHRENLAKIRLAKNGVFQLAKYCHMTIDSRSKLSSLSNST